MKKAIILGIGSDIGRELAVRLDRDGWVVSGFRHDQPLLLSLWNLVVCCYGTLEPIGPFWILDDEDWEQSFQANAFLPLRQIKQLYPYRRHNASVCWFSGAGSGGTAPTYSAYSAAKVMMIKMAELLNAESPDCKFFVLGPGVVRTKIHQQTLQAGNLAANLERVSEFVNSDELGTSHDDIYACLTACVSAPKSVIGGRNVYVPLDDWTRLDALRTDPDKFKLRRAGDQSLRRVTR